MYLNKRIFIFLSCLSLYAVELYAVNSKSGSETLPTVQSPIAKELKSEIIKQRLISEKKNKNLLQFMLGVSYFRDEDYGQAYKALNKVSRIQYLEDYIKYYRSVSALEYFDTAEMLKKNLNDLYSVLSNGDPVLYDEVKAILPDFEFKTAQALAGAKNYSSSFDYYARARTKGYSDLESEFGLIKKYTGYNKELALSLLLDLNRRFNPADIKKLFDTLPEKIKTELYALSNYKLSQKDTADVSNYRKTESDVITLIKDAINAKDTVKTRDLGTEYLKTYPQGTYHKRFYDISYSFVENSIINGNQKVSYYKDLLNYYDKGYLDKLVVKLFQKTDLNEVEDLLNILLNKYPQYDKGLYLMGTLQEDKGNSGKAIRYYKNIVEGFPQSQYYQRSLFKYAWLEMISGSYSDSIELFTRYIDEGKDNYDWSVTAALYFKARCLDKKSKHDDAKTVKQELISRFPYSFYSLILMEEEGISLSQHIKDNIKPLDSTAEAASPQELRSIRTAIMLVKTGLTDMAVKELSNINLDKLSPGYVDVITSIYKYSSNPDMTIMAAGKLMNSLKGYASQEHAETHFPKLYFDNIKKFSDNYGVQPFIMLAIMKRESAFKKDAVSSSGALGLMQLMPDTAQSVDPKIKTKSLKDPEKNIKIAAEYLKSL
ncbi:MAG: DUF3808 domain-containing protein, partial [Proteobacteria bacterium]|nr:DUF3808 domain-containing protein [Pseudomonadota bacterium]